MTINICNYQYIYSPLFKNLSALSLCTRYVENDGGFSFKMQSWIYIIWNGVQNGLLSLACWGSCIRFLKDGTDTCCYSQPRVVWNISVTLTALVLCSAFVTWWMRFWIWASVIRPHRSQHRFCHNGKYGQSLLFSICSELPLKSMGVWASTEHVTKAWIGWDNSFFPRDCFKVSVVSFSRGNIFLWVIHTHFLAIFRH